MTQTPTNPFVQRFSLHVTAIFIVAAGTAFGAESPTLTGVAGTSGVPVPVLTLNGRNPLTNECHTLFNDPGATARGAPLAIAAGGEFSLALKRDGTLVGWGDWTGGTIPTDLKNVVAIDGGRYHGLALKADGTVVAWGLDINGPTRVPAGISNAVSIAAGDEHNLALLATGTVVAWGLNSYGQASVPSGINNVIAVAAGSIHSLALRRDGTVVGWGNNSYGQLTTPVGLRNLVAIAAGSVHNLALDADGTVTAWGDNSFGQTQVPTGLSNVVAIAAGAAHSLALQRNGSVVAWGRDDGGQTIVPSGLSNVVALAAGDWHNLALQDDGTVIAWGYRNFFGQTTVPAGLTTLTNIVISSDVDANRPGIYTLSYGLTDLLGTSIFTNRIVVVVDTTPPDLQCPTNITVNFSDEMGARVSFAVQATDLCSGPVPVTCVPPSGTRFRIGTTTVLCAATDASGHRASCSFQVKVKGARSVIESVVQQLVVLKSRTTNPATLLNLDQAIRHLNRALDPSLWQDDTHLHPKIGNRVFQNGKSAVKVLLQSTRERDREISDEEFYRLIEQIVKTLRLLAVVEIDDAAIGNADPRKIARDRRQVTRGDEDAAAKNWLAAIQHYRNAWNHAVHLQIRIAPGVSNGGVHIEFVGLPGQVYILEASTNLIDWITVGTSTSGPDGSVVIEDTDAAPYRVRFYRVPFPP